MADRVPPTIEPFGDAAILVSLGSIVDPALAARAQAISAAIGARRDTAPAIGRPVPAHASVLVPFDPLALEPADVIEVVRSAIAAADGAGDADADDPDGAGTSPDDGIDIEIPVRYGGVDGPDLDEVAALLGMRPQDVVDLHAAARYRVLFLGFAPGFGYLGGLPAAARDTAPGEPARARARRAASGSPVARRPSTRSRCPAAGS